VYRQAEDSGHFHLIDDFSTDAHMRAPWSIDLRDHGNGIIYRSMDQTTILERRL